MSLLAFSGCLDGDVPIHAVTVGTSYDPQQTPEEDRDRGPDEGSPAAGGRLYVHLVEESAYEDYKQQLDSGLFDPPTPQNASEGDRLTLPSDQTSERFLISIGSDGVGEFGVLADRPLMVLVDLEGQHPAPPSDCRWSYHTDDPIEEAVDPKTNGTIPYGIAC